MINILFTIPNFHTAGSGKVVYDLVKGLDKSKFRVHLLVDNKKGAFFKEYVSLLPIVILEYSFDKSYAKPLVFFKNIIQFRRLLRKYKIDLLHSWDWSSNLFELIACKFSGVKYGYTKKSMSWGSRSWIIKSKYSDFIVRLNDDIQKLLFDPYNIESEKIYIGLDTDYYCKLNMHNEAQVKPYFLTVANLVPIKGIEYLIRAFEKLNRDDIELYIVGNNENEYGQTLRNMTLNPNIVFINKVLDVRPYLANSIAYFIPTLKPGEGLGVALLEAMSMKTMVYGSNVPGVKEILKDFPDSLFEPGNENEILEKMKNAINMSKEFRDFSTNTFRDFVVKNFELNKFIKRHEYLYLKQVSH